MARLKRSAFMQNKVLFMFGNRYFIHVLVLILAFFVASTNILQAKEMEHDDQFGQDSTLFKIVNPGGELGEDVVERGLISETTTAYVDTSGMMEANIANLDPTAEAPRTIGDQLALLDSGSALLSSTAPETSTGNRAGMTEYKIKDGDTIGDIAERFGLTVNTVLWANSLTTNSYIKPGDALKIPPASGVLYTVASGDTLDKIIEKYKGNLDDTIRINDLGSDHSIAEGKEILIAGGTPPPPPPTAQTSYLAANAASSRAASTTTGVAPAVTGGKLNWPVGCQGDVTTYPGHPNHARDLLCPYGTPIYAAESGTVKIRNSGCLDYNQYCGGGYGNYLDIDSANGLMTRYAHQKPNGFTVHDGQYVNRGDNIGFVGMTGRTSGPHLHFEVWINGASYDPKNYLY